jgi:hypothetical protein
MCLCVAVTVCTLWLLHIQQRCIRGPHNYQDNAPSTSSLPPRPRPCASSPTPRPRRTHQRATLLFSLSSQRWSSYHTFAFDNDQVRDRHPSLDIQFLSSSLPLVYIFSSLFPIARYLTQCSLTLGISVLPFISLPLFIVFSTTRQVDLTWPHASPKAHQSRKRRMPINPPILPKGPLIADFLSPNKLYSLCSRRPNAWNRGAPPQIPPFNPNRGQNGFSPNPQGHANGKHTPTPATDDAKDKLLASLAGSLVSTPFDLNPVS